MAAGAACCLAITAVGGGGFSAALLDGLVSGTTLVMAAGVKVGSGAGALPVASMESVCVSVRRVAGVVGGVSWSPMFAMTASMVPAGGLVIGRRDQRGGATGCCW